MKLVKTASGKDKIKLSKSEWTNLGKKAGWLDKEAMPLLMDAKAKKITTVEEMLSLKDSFGAISACNREDLAEAYLNKGPFYLITNMGSPLYMCHPATDGYYDMNAREIEDKEWCKSLISDQA